MGISFKVSDVEHVKFPKYEYVSKNGDFISHLEEYKNIKFLKVLQHTSIPRTTKVCRQDNGFVNTVTDAYNYHQNLQLRPDDIWIAIMTQFSIYVNANSEELRSTFVAHEGQKTVTVTQEAFLDTADYSKLALDMMEQLKLHISDPLLADWIVPNFSTTEENDIVIGSAVMMSTLKSYFKYRYQLLCGIPEITLLGTTTDWKNIYDRAKRLRLFGDQCSKWVEILLPILEQFHETSKGNIDVEFWKKICSYYSEGSGSDYVSGWITVFCVFGDKGRWQGEIGTSFERMVCKEGYPRNIPSSWEKQKIVSEYPRIDTDDIPSGYVTMPIIIDDNGMEHKSIMFAGHMLSERLGENSFAPKLTWAIALLDESNVEDYED